MKDLGYLACLGWEMLGVFVRSFVIWWSGLHRLMDCFGEGMFLVSDEGYCVASFELCFSERDSARDWWV